MSNFLYESRHPGSFILSESNQPHYSRDNVTLSGAAVIQTGQVCGKVTASGAVVPWNPGANDGSQNAACLPVYRYDTTGGDVQGAVISRDAQVKADGLVWPVGVAPADKAAAIAALKALGILVR